MMKNLLNRNIIYLVIVSIVVIILTSLYINKNENIQLNRNEDLKQYIKNSIENINTSQVYVLESTPDSPIRKKLILKVDYVKGDKIKMINFSQEKHYNINAYLSLKEILKNKDNSTSLSLSKQNLINAIKKTEYFESIPKSDFHFEGTKYWISNVYNMGSPFFEVQKFRKNLNSIKDDGFILTNYGGSGKVLSIKPYENEVKITTKFPKDFSYFDNKGNQNIIIKVETENLYHRKSYDFDMIVLDSLNRKQFYKINLFSIDDFVNQIK